MGQHNSERLSWGRWTRRNQLEAGVLTSTVRPVIRAVRLCRRHIAGEIMTVCPSKGVLVMKVLDRADTAEDSVTVRALARPRWRSRAWKRSVIVAGRTIAAMYRHRLGWVFGNRLAVITHRGRLSGRRYQTVVYVQRWDPVAIELTVVSVWGESDWLRNICTAPAEQVAIGRVVLDHPGHRFLATDEIADVEAEFRGRDRTLAWGQAKLMGWPWPATPSQLRELSAGLRGVVFTPSGRTTP